MGPTKGYLNEALKRKLKKALINGRTIQSRETPVPQR